MTVTDQLILFSVVIYFAKRKISYVIAEKQKYVLERSEPLEG